MICATTWHLDRYYCSDVWDFDPIRSIDLASINAPLLKILILGKAQNQVIYLKYKSCKIVLCKNKAVEAIFIHLNQQFNGHTDSQDFHFQTPSFLSRQ